MIWARRLGLAGLVVLASLLALDKAFPPPLERGNTVSTWVADRDGHPLRAFPLKTGTWRLKADTETLDPVFIEALLKVEDKRFWRHGGVDWLGMVRAGWSSAKAGRIVSGGSTITMQTARLLEPRPRTLRSKLIEMFRAHQIEARLTKTEILELYLSLTPYGGNLEGVRAASWRYFGREPTRLSDDQIALLIALPQSPEVRRPDSRPQGAAAGRAKIVAKLKRLGYLDRQRAEEASQAPLPTSWTPFPAQAWHAAAQAARGRRGDVVSTLDIALQAELEAIAERAAKAAGPDVQVAMIVVDRKSRAVRASVGSASRERAGGWIDLTAQPRSPGSTLKPFIYGMAFDDGSASPQTKIADLPKRFSAYQPENFDRMFRGDVRISEALQHSLNIPAVLALDRVGPQRFAATLALAGAPPRISGGAVRDPGLALALGGAGLTLREVAVLYGALGDHGRAKPLVWTEPDLQNQRQQSGYRLMSSESAAQILDILRATPTPAGRMPGFLTQGAPQIAFKTGTSYGFRDAWAAGVSGDQVLVVWVGRADGTPRPGQTGRVAALPILFEVADRAAHHLGAGDSAQDRLQHRPATPAIGALSQFGEDQPAPEILFPPKNAELWSGPVNGKPARAFVFAGRGAGDLTWYVDGVPANHDDAGLAVWKPSGGGFYTISAVDPSGQTSSVKVRVLTTVGGDL